MAKKESLKGKKEEEIEKKNTGAIVLILVFVAFLALLGIVYSHNHNLKQKNNQQEAKEDLNKDGKVDATDLDIFKKHLAGEAGYETFPYNKLVYVIKT